MTRFSGSRRPAERISTRQRRLMQGAGVLLACLLTAAGSGAAPSEPGILGQWRLDATLTAAAQPVEGHRKSAFEGLSIPSISVNGMPLPGPSGGTAPAAGGAPDPDVLRCGQMTIAAMEGDLLVTYTGVGSETLTPGRVQGVTTRWKGDYLESAYATTSRKVRKRFELQRDGTLVVTVKLTPVNGSSLTHKRVFRRDDGSSVNPG